MMENVGIYRNHSDIQKAIEAVLELRQRFKEVRVQDKNKKFNTDLLDILELANLLDIAYVTAVSAQNRTETRGAHSREDYKERDDEKWLKHSMASMKEDKIKIEYKSVDVSLFKPKPRTY